MPANKSAILARLVNPGIIAVVRAKSAEQVLPLTEALLLGGVIAIEITMTTPDAISAIRAAVKRFGSSALIGVGTVLDEETCRQALGAGAEFVVSPILRPGHCRSGAYIRAPRDAGRVYPDGGPTRL